MKTNDLNDVLCTELCDILNAEKQLSKALPKMADMASDPELAQGFRTHLRETEGQIARLEQVFEILDKKPKHEKCEVMKGLIHEANELTGGCEKGPVCDAALIASAQKVEHYEIASYGTIIALCKSLGHTRAAELLEQSLQEEKATNLKLNDMAEGHINQDAVRQAA